MQILVSGASFAGLASAFWMRRLGHDVAIVEVAPGLRRGGTAVDIRGNTVGIAERMGILEQIRANRLSLQRTQFVTADGSIAREQVVRAPGQPPPDDEFEIERDVLLAILHEAVRGDVEIGFGDSISAMRETAAGVEVAFARGAPRTFDLVLGCDGVHSAVRRLWFGAEAEFVHFLGTYFSVTIVDQTLIERDTLQMFNVPGKAIMLNAYKDKTDIVLAFASDAELPYDYRNEAQQRAIVAAQFADVPWRAAELLAEVQRSPTFYFDKLCQVHMPAWSRGRVALVGDAAYCASPAAGMGGSLALDGAAALADAMREHGGDYARAFSAYDAAFRPFLDGVQAAAVQFGVEMLVPRTEEAIRARNAATDE